MKQRLIVLFVPTLFEGHSSVIMANLRYLLLILLLPLSNGTEPPASTDVSTDVTQEDIIEASKLISLTCFSCEACQPECCQLYHLYSIAKNNCTTDIDGQLAAVKWFSPFAKVYHPFWKSVCSPNASRELHSSPLNETYEYLVGDSLSCNNFHEFSYRYVDLYLNIAASDNPENGILWSNWLPISAVIFSCFQCTFVVALYLMVPELHRKIQAKCLLFYFATRLMSSVVYIILWFYEPTTDISCYFIGKSKRIHQVDLSLCIHNLATPYKTDTYQECPP